MKNLLIASTALVASAGFASADIALDGSANMGVKYNAAAANTTTIHHEVDFGISGSGTTDGGLTFGASLDVDDQNGDDGNVNDSEVFISGAFGTLTVGSVSAATDGFGSADVGFDGIGVDDDAEGIKNAGGTADAHFKATFDALTITVAGHSTNGDASIALGYKMGDFSASIGHSDNSGLGGNRAATSIQLGGTFGAVKANAFYTDGSGSVTTNGYGVDFGYTMGATTFTIAYGDTDAAGDDADYGIGAAHSLGGGATLAGGVGSVDGVSVADFGINLSF
ncbi:MAG: outer membrane protein OmpU [Sulfitobacter sp.]|jgi:outer membrane protein OmpU